MRIEAEDDVVLVCQSLCLRCKVVNVDFVQRERGAMMMFANVVSVVQDNCWNNDQVGRN